MTSGPRSVAVRATLAVGLAVLCAGAPAAAQKFDADKYFAGKTIRLIVPSNAGGGADVRTRIFAEIAGKRYFPGKPRFSIINIPGAGGEIGIRRGVESKPDGLTTFRVSGRFLLREVIGKPFEVFDYSKSVMLGADHNFQPRIWYVRRDVAKSWDEILKLGRPVIEGATDLASSGGELAALLGYPVKMVYGYGGAAQVRAALARKEIEATYQAGPHMLELYPELVKQGAFIPIFYWETNPKDDPQTLRYLEALGAKPPPHIFDVIKASKAEQTVFDVGTSFPTATTFLPPGTPTEIADVWRKVMVDVYADQEMKDRSLAAGTSVTWVKAEDIQSLVSRGKEVVKEERYLMLLKNLVGDQ